MVVARAPLENTTTARSWVAPNPTGAEGVLPVVVHVRSIQVGQVLQPVIVSTCPRWPEERGTIVVPDKLVAVNAMAKCTTPGKVAGHAAAGKLLAIHGARARIALLENINVSFYPPPPPPKKLFAFLIFTPSSSSFFLSPKKMTTTKKQLLAVTTEAHARLAPVDSTRKTRVPVVVILVRTESSPRIRAPQVANFVTTVSTSGRIKVVVPTAHLESTTLTLVVLLPARSASTVQAEDT